MADGHPNLNLTPEEKRAFYQLFQAADKTNLGVVTGEVAVSFFEKTHLPAETLGLIWQLADTQNRGLLTPSGFSVVLRLIGHAQAGRQPTEQLALQPGPLPKFDGINIDLDQRPQSAASPPPTGGAGPVRVPSLNPDDIAKFSSLFLQSETQGGLMPGDMAKGIFERARLPNAVLGRIWNLADTKQRGALDHTEFIIAMHLLTAYRTGTMKGVPQTLPPGLYEAAARRVNVRSGSRSSSDVPPVPAIPKQFSGSGRAQSPLNRPQFASPVSAQATGNEWLITPQEKAQYDSVFATVDRAKAGYINGDQAVGFFSNAQLPEDTLAQIWDLADIDADGQLSRDEFAVAMYLVRLQRSTGGPLPQTLPPALMPPSMRRPLPRVASPPVPIQQQVTGARSAAEDLFGLDVFSASPQIPQSTGGSGSVPTSPSRRPGPAHPTSFKPFIPTSSFGQSLAPQVTGATPAQTRSPPQPSDDLLGDADPEESKKLTQETADLANLSNQVSALSKEMQNVQGKRASAEQDLAKTSQQKRDFEARLAQARTMYEQEVRGFKTLEERLAASRAETKKLQQDYSILDATRQDLQNQHNQVSAALETDQRENANLKEKIRQANVQISQLKPQLDKMKSEARQQKGLVAINKKQLTTLEGERDRLQDEIGALSKSNDVEAVQPQATGGSTPGSGPVTSPALSTASQRNNPFFKRTQTETSVEDIFGLPPPGGDGPKDAQSAFDNLFGPSVALASTTSSPPPTSFRAQSPGQAVSQDADALKAATPASSPPALSFPSIAEPPPPPESRQISPSALPLEAHRSPEPSSVRPSPPQSRFGESSTSSEATNTPERSSKEDKSEEEPTPSLPGAFPAEADAPGNGAKKDISFDEVFGGRGVHQRSQSQRAQDFEEAFAAMKVKPAGGTKDSLKANGDSADPSEFPPIRELDDDDVDDSSSEGTAPAGFDDDFTPTSPTKPEGFPAQGDRDFDAFKFPSIETVGNASVPPAPPAKTELSPPSSTEPPAGGAQPVAQHATGNSAFSAGGSKKPDFEAAFAGLDLAPAKETDDEDEDDEDEDDFASPFNNNKGGSTFNMSFDSPQSAPKPVSSNNTGANPKTDADFFRFDNNNDAFQQSGAQADLAQPAKPPSSHDWDALFSALDASKGNNGADAQGTASADSSTTDPTAGSFPQPPGQTKQPGWALSVDSGDDQMLERLTAMGYARDESLAALEKFDYNIDRAADFLASKS